MHIIIMDLKWSYGNEVLIRQLARQWRERAEVLIISEGRPLSTKGKAVTNGYWNSLKALVNPLTYGRILRRVRKANPDIIYFLSPHILNVPLTLLCRLVTSGCVIGHVHDSQYSRSRPVAAYLADTVAYLQGHLSHRVYCFGRSIQQGILNRFDVPEKRIAVFRLGPGHPTPADDRVQPGPSRNPKYFSQIGTILERKGVHYFLEAARMFNDRHGSDVVTFVLAGIGDLKKYEAEIAQIPNLELRNRFIEDGEVNEILQNSYASILPYTDGIMQSSFVAIAYGNGCPVIVSDLGGLPEEVEHGKTGFVVARRSAEQLADAMTQIYESEIEHFTANCIRAYRERFDWSSIADQMYRDMLATTRKLPGVRLREQE